MLSEVNFVIDCSDSALEDYKHLQKTDAPGIFVRGDLNWCLQTYLILSEYSKLPISCSNRLKTDCINIIHSDTLLTLKGDSSHFIVCVKADYPKRLWAHYHIVQNTCQVTSSACYVPHWIQPGILKRDKNRNDDFVVAYAGQPTNGNMAGTPDTWKRLLEPHNIKFVVLNAGNWHDLRSVDVLVGIRSFDKRSYHTKPPTKLFNAWHAEVPFVGGNDSAFKQVGSPGKDYLLATTPDEALNCILALRDDNNLYQSIVENGKISAQRYTDKTIAQVWDEVLAGPINERYNRWQLRFFYEKIWFNIMVSLSGPEYRSKKLIKKVFRIG